MSDREHGLYNKYFVSKAVKTMVAGKEYGNLMPVKEFCFVLVPEKDPGAVVALRAYIDWCWDNGYDFLAEDLEAMLDT